MPLQSEDWMSVEPGSRFISSLLHLPTVCIHFRFSYISPRGATQLDYLFVFPYAKGVE